MKAIIIIAVCAALALGGLGGYFGYSAVADDGGTITATDEAGNVESCEIQIGDPIVSRSEIDDATGEVTSDLVCPDELGVIPTPHQ
jgi:hypothetical protein